MAHYISIVIPLSAGGWRALFPDVPDCAAEGDSLDMTVFRAAGALSSCVATRYSNGKAAPAPRPLSEIKADGDWAAAHHVDWAKAVVTMVPLHAAHGA